jgi:hypothetical protein
MNKDEERPLRLVSAAIEQVQTDCPDATIYAQGMQVWLDLLEAAGLMRDICREAEAEQRRARR